MMYYLVALVLTLLIEFVIYWATLKFFNISNKSILLLVLGLNLLTHPLAFAAVMGVDQALGLVEFIVVFAEALVLWVILKKRFSACLLVSVLANTGSFVLGSMAFGSSLVLIGSTLKTELNVLFIFSPLILLLWLISTYVGSRQKTAY